MKRKKLPKGWPSKDGRPATREEILDWIKMVEDWFGQPRFSTAVHFCCRCTAPLEFEPCPVCEKVQRENVAKLRAILVVEAHDRQNGQK